jgi:hypothetical protein
VGSVPADRNNSEPPPTRPPTKVQLEREEVAPCQSTAPPPYSRPPHTATSPEGSRGRSRRGRRGRGRATPSIDVPTQALMLNANLQRSLTPGVSSWDGYPRTWPHINFIARENNIPIYQARERFANYDVASLYEAWRTPIPPAPRMPDPREDRSRPRQLSRPTVRRLVATTTPRRPPAASTSTAGSSISTMGASVPMPTPGHPITSPRLVPRSTLTVADLDPDEDDYGYDIYEDYNWEA